MSSIEWTDETWNPVTGCTKVSAGCKNCYAERLFPRPYPDRPFTDVRFHRERLNQPRRWRKPRRVFVNSMSDLFHESVRDRDIEQIFYVMSDTPQHVFQVLTKRPERMRDFMRSRTAKDCTYGDVWPLTNVWLGVSVEDQLTADERIPLLLDTPAAVRFLSVEPLLAPVDMSGRNWIGCAACGICSDYENDRGQRCCDMCSSAVDHLIDWVIVGGESGPKARPCELRWIGHVVDQCKRATVPVFVKQLGARPMHRSFFDDEPGQVALKDRKGGNPNEWPPELRVREWPAQCLASTAARFARRSPA